MTLTPLSNEISVLLANDLKPCITILLMYAMTKKY
jgi:hypothetical protein